MLRSLRLTALALLLGIAQAHAAFDYEIGGTPPYSGTQLITDINEELAGIEGVITDAETSCIAALTSAADKVPYFTGLGTCALADLTSAGRALIDDADASAQRTTLGLVIGTNVQAFDADLTTYAGITPSANVQSLLGAASYAAMRALLDLEAGTDFYSIAAADAAFQPLDADLTAIAGLTSAADKVPYFTGSGTAAVADFSAAIRTLITTPSSANLRSMLSDETGTGAAMFGLTAAMADDLSCTGSQVVRRNAGDTAFECATVSVSDTLGPDGDKGDISVGGTGTTLTIDAAAVSADELDEAGVEAGLEAVLDLADLQGDLALGTKTSGNYVDDVTAGTGIAITHTPGEGSDAAVALSYSDQGANPALSADQCVFTSNATTSGFIVCEGDTADTFETRVTVTDPTADRLFTIPNADSVAVQPNTCSGTDKVTGVSSAGVVSCAADEGGAGSGDNIGVEDGDNAGTYTAASDANFEDSGDINFTLNTTPSPDEISATIRADAVALTTDTTGNYVGSVADGTGIDGTAAGEGATYTPTLDLTEISSATWGAGSFTSFTFDAGATDPVLTLSSAAVTWSGVTTYNLDDEAELRFFEEDAGGSNYIGFKPPAAITSNVTCTFENDANPIPDTCVGDGSDDDVPESGDFTNLSATAPITQSSGTISTSMATNRLIGRTTASSGVMEEIAVGSAYALSSLTLRSPRETWCVALSDETTAITTGTAKARLVAPYAFTVTSVYAFLSTASSSGAPAFDINEDTDAEGVTASASILSTTITIDASERRSSTAATPPVVSDSAIAANSELLFDIDTAGTGATGAKVCIVGYQT